MTRDAIFSALGLADTNSGVYARGWRETSGTAMDVENPATGVVRSPRDELLL